MAQHANSLQHATPELRESLATELVVKRDRCIADLEKSKVYENGELNRGYSVLKENLTEHSDMRIACATSRHTVPVHNVKFLTAVSKEYSMTEYI